MAKEFPNIQHIVSLRQATISPPDWQGVDLVPVQYVDTPDNLQFLIEDVTQGLSYPDGYFTVLHSRLMLAGVRSFACSR